MPVRGPSIDEGAGKIRTYRVSMPYTSTTSSPGDEATDACHEHPDEVRRRQSRFGADCAGHEQSEREQGGRAEYGGDDEREDVDGAGEAEHARDGEGEGDED